MSLHGKIPAMQRKPREASRRTFNTQKIALLIDRVIGPMLCWPLVLIGRPIRKKLARPAEGAPTRILLVKMWGIGSIILATPLLRSIRQTYPNARVDFLSLSQNRPILEILPWVDRVYTVSLDKGLFQFAVETVRLIGTLRRVRFDVVFDLEFFTFFSAILTFLIAPSESRGFGSNRHVRGRLHTSQAPFSSDSHVATNFEALLSEPGVAIIRRAAPHLPQIQQDAGIAQRVTARLAAHHSWLPDRPLVVANPNASDLALERRWPAGQFAELLRLIADEREVNIALIGSRSERRHVESVIAFSKRDDLINVAGELDLRELIELLRQATVLVTNDSGPLHLASAVGTATVSLFGPETPTLYGPLTSTPNQEHIVHYERLQCSPCINVHANKEVLCWYAEARCMTSILPRDVAASISSILGDRPSRLPVVNDSARTWRLRATSN